MQPATPVDTRGASPIYSRETVSQDCATSAQVTILLCANSGRPGMVPPSGVRERPWLPPVEWPFSVQEIVMPCAGKIQPEIILKAFELGADLVCVIACDEDNCHYLEGSPRARVRVEYVKLLLDEMGLGGERLMLFHLPGSAREDMALGSKGGSQPAKDADVNEEIALRLKAISDEIAGKLKALGANPLRGASANA